MESTAHRIRQIRIMPIGDVIIWAVMYSGLIYVSY